MNEVLFAEAKPLEPTAHHSLPTKFGRLLRRLELAGTVEGRSVAVKMHTGGDVGYTTIHPVFVRVLVDAVKEAGAKRVAVMDGEIGGAGARGYTEEILGCPVVSCFGQTGGYLYRKKIGFHGLDWAHYGGNAWDADVFIDFSHVKGHGCCGFGGAIKNIAMGCVPPKTRALIHRLEGGIVWDAEKCVQCLKCVKECPRHANEFDEKGVYHVDFHNCTFCQHCILACPAHALELMEADFDTFQEGLARVAGTFLDHFPAERRLFINVLTNITIFCDCWGMSCPPLHPDVGVLAGRNIVAVETASLDRIKASRLIEEGVPKNWKMARRTGHLFERLHGKDPWTQVRKMDELGYGPGDYKLVRVR
jgi:uncharacterized Fe-S center protein